jgi:hypothetical protein
MKNHKQLPELTDIQLEFIDGSMLGDGSICHDRNKPNRNWWFSKGQSMFSHSGHNKIEYMNWHMFMMGEHSQKLGEHHGKAKFPDPQFNTDKIYSKYAFATCHHPIWNRVGKRWYMHDSQGCLMYHPVTNRKIKIVPQDLILTPLMLCIWYMDDGSNYPKDANLTLETEGFAKTEVEFLIERLKVDLGIVAKLKKARNDQWRIYVGRKSYFEFIDIVKPHVHWNCFGYKTDTSAYVKKPGHGATHHAAKLTEDQVREIFKLSEDGLLNKEIAQRFSACTTLITQILNGKRWSHITGVTRHIPKKVNPSLTAEQKLEVMVMIRQGVFQHEVAKIFNVDQSTISRIYKHEKSLVGVCGQQESTNAD